MAPRHDVYIAEEGYDYREDGYLNESISVDSNEKEPDKCRYLIEEVQPPENE